MSAFLNLRFVRTICLTLVCLLGFESVVWAAPTITYLHNDTGGSPVAATDATGTVVWRESYRPYGERTKNEPAASTNTQFFHGKPVDTDTGLSYFGARYYDPVAGRFMGIDPVGFDEANIHSFNRYAYGNNNPYKYQDPDGRLANFVFGALIGGGIELGFQLAAGNGVNLTSIAIAAGVGAVTGGVSGIAARAATLGRITTTQAVAGTAAVGGEAAAAGKLVESAVSGKSVTSKEVAASAVAGALGSAVGTRLATHALRKAEKLAASGNNVVSGIGNATLGAIREGGAPGSVSVGASEVTQKVADVLTGVSGKAAEDSLK